jgi:TRAP-type C4-dicarboxylate transport system permease small subunit
MTFRKLVDGTFEAITAFLIVGMVLLTLLQVITRYGLNAGFELTEELARLDLIYLTFFGSVVALRRREHLRIETLVNALPVRSRKFILVAVDIASVAVLAIVVWQGVPLLRRFWSLQSAALGWPTTFFYLPVVFGCLVMMIYFFFDAVARMSGNGKEQMHREGEPQ